MKQFLTALIIAITLVTLAPFPVLTLSVIAAENGEVVDINTASTDEF